MNPRGNALPRLFRKFQGRSTRPEIRDIHQEDEVLKQQLKQYAECSKTSVDDEFRTLAVAPVCRALRDSVYRSINSVAFYKTQLDELSDTRIKYFLSIHGSKITAINFDLFRSACTQWSWRQSVITAVKMCSNLRELDILICKRHRLRDTDLLTIFRQCPQLQVLCIDAQYLSGHCFQIVSGLVSNMKNLRDLSIIGNPKLSASALGHLARLPRLQNLCLEGIPAVTDRFLAELSDAVNNPAARSIRSLSLAFCFNFSSVGLQRLARMTKLDSLNLDGITKRDISSGLLKIAEEGRLIRVGKHLCKFIVELEAVIIYFHSLLCEMKITFIRSVLGHASSLCFRIFRSEVILGSVLSRDDSSQLPHGLLLPRLRRGNRYRLLCSLLSMSQELTDLDDQVTETKFRNALN
uniref:F-box domain-containing protein n=1 Tax=Angiostrongylus cantonensis TaxID=6313 RepID=A0A158PA42_ANGCA